MLERRSGYEYEDLLACGRGEMFGPGDPGADMLDELRLGDRLSGRESHECGDDLAPLFVR